MICKSHKPIFYVQQTIENMSSVKCETFYNKPGGLSQL